MKGFRRVLAPIDFSPSSAKVLAMAGRVVEADGEIVLLHVVDWVPTVVEGAFVTPNVRETNTLRTESLQKLEEMKRAHAGLPIRPEVCEGQPATEIIDLSQRLPADLIVIATHGRSGIGHLLLGSVAERVLRRAQCPVLVVRS